MTDPQQLLQQYVAAAAATPGDNLPYPVDWGQPAATPTVVQALAEATQAALDTRARVTPFGVPVGDWDQATYSNQSYWSAPGAANAPSTVIVGHWMGIAIVHNDVWLTQLAWPFAASGGVPPSMMMTRAHTAAGWTPWSRVTNYVHSYGGLDGFTWYQHVGINRFAAGLKYGGTDGAPAEADTYRVQVYDRAGAYRRTAMQVTTEGLVTFPAGHTALEEDAARVPADTAATVGMVAILIFTALDNAGLLDTRARRLGPYELAGLLTEGTPDGDD